MVRGLECLSVSKKNGSFVFTRLTDPAHQDPIKALSPGLYVSDRLALLTLNPKNLKRNMRVCPHGPVI